MGRPLNKKYFGNTNVVGTGGLAVASIAVTGTNTAYIAKPAITIGAPTLVGGVQAVASAHMAVVGVTNFTTGTSGYAPSQVLTLAGGTGTQATLTVSTTRIAAVTVGSVPGTGYTTGDVVTIQGGTGTLATATVIASAGAVTGFSTFTPGSYTVNPGSLDEVATVKTGGTGDDALTVDITIGVDTVAITTAGDYTALPADVSIVGHTGGGTGALFNLTYKVLSVEVTTAGSGYESAPAVADAPDGNATFTATMTASGVAAIIAYAFTAGASKVADIVKQVSSRYYKVKTADSTVGVDDRALLVTATPVAVGEMTIMGTDAAAGTYYITKLTARRATVTPGTGTVWTAGQSVAWTFGTADANTIKIDNA